MSNRILTGTLLLLLLAAPAGAQTPPRDGTPPAQLAVSPSRFEVPVGSTPATESLSLMNLGDRPVEVQVSLASWDLDAENQVRILEPNEQSLDQWMVIQPTRFTIPARGSQTVRFSIRPRVRPEPGEHRAMIYFEQVLPEARDSRVQVRFRLGVAVYGLVGDVVREGTLIGSRVDADPQGPLRAALEVDSTGTANVRLRGQYAIYAAAEYPGAAATTEIPRDDAPDAGPPAPVLAVGRLPSQPVLPGTRRTLTFTAPADLPPGEYVMDLNGDLAGRPIDVGVPFRVPGPPGLLAKDPPTP